MDQAQHQEVIVEVDIAAAKDKVWRIMFEEISSWWPADFLGVPGSKQIKLEPRVGGRLYEESEDGGAILWGQLVMIVPGVALEFIGATTPTFGGLHMNSIRMEVKEAGENATAFRLSNAIMGRISEDGVAQVTEGWKYLFADKFKAYVESQ